MGRTEMTALDQGTLAEVKDLCLIWGRQKRRVLSGGDGKGHVDGHRSASSVNLFREPSSTKRAVSQFTEEGISGDGLIITRAMNGAPEIIQSIVFQQYVVRGQKVEAKAADIGLRDPKEYYRILRDAHMWIAARLPVPAAVNYPDTVRIVSG